MCGHGRNKRYCCACRYGRNGDPRNGNLDFGSRDLNTDMVLIGKGIMEGFNLKYENT
jgi:hypothetical protein